MPGSQLVTMSDRRSYLVHHRHIAVLTAGASVETVNLQASALYLPPDPATTDVPFDPHGAQMVEARIIFGGATGQTINNVTCQWTIVGVPRFPVDETPAARRLLLFTATASSPHVHTHPKTGLAVTGMEYHEPDTFSSIKAWTAYKVRDGTTDESGAQDLPGCIQFDPAGLLVYAFCTAIDTTYDDITTPTLDMTLREVG